MSLNKTNVMKTIKGTFIAVVLATMIIGLYKMGSKQVVPSDFTLKNIEALVDEEGTQYLCLGDGNQTCPSSGRKVKAVLIYSR